MKSFRILAVLALSGLVTVPSMKAALLSMNDYDMESGESMNDDLFGFLTDSTTWYLVQFTFSNVTFADSTGGPFNLTGFDIYKDGTKAGGGTLVGTTEACSGIASPFPAEQTSITCGVPLGVTLSDTPYFVFPRAGSVGLMKHTTPGVSSTVELQGLRGGTPPVPEPATAALTLLGLGAVGVLRHRLRSRQ